MWGRGQRTRGDSIMGFPIILAVMAGGAVVNMAIGYVVETRTRIGDGNYSARDATIDGIVGATGYGS